MNTSEESLFEAFTEYIKKPNDILPEQNQTDSMKNQLKAYTILIPALGVLIILMNLAVVISSGLILKTGQQPKCTYLLLGNVAMADLVTGIAVIMGNLLPKENRTHSVCTLQIGMIVSTTLASIYSVGLIAIDRYLYIVHGLLYSQWVYPRRARFCIVLTWTLGLIVGFLPLMGWSGDTDNGRICWFTFVFPPELIILITTLGCIPVLLVIYLYSIILVKAIRKIIQLNESGNGNSEIEPKLRIFRGNQNSANSSNSAVEKEKVGRESSNKNVDSIRATFTKSIQNNADLERANKKAKNLPNKWKAIKVVLLTTGSFVATWIPYFIACTIYVFCDDKATPAQCHNLKYAIASPLAILGFINSLLNPLIYAWWHNGFRKTLKKIFCKKKQARFPVNTAPRATALSLTHTTSTSSSSLSSGRMSSITEVPY